MHQTHPVTDPRRKVYLVAASGEVYVYDSYREFLSYLRSDVIDGMGKSFREVRYYYTHRIFWNDYTPPERIRIYTQWIAHWDHKSGSIIDLKQLKSDWEDYRNELNRKRRFSNWWYARYHRHFEYRHDPVPCIHKHHGHYGTYLRHIQTTQERRWSLAAKEDGVRWRGKRNFHNLPNAWDDICRNSEKNWKRFRKHQWKA